MSVHEQQNAGQNCNIQRHNQSSAHVQVCEHTSKSKWHA